MDGVVSFISRDSPENADRWVVRLDATLGGLTEFPLACSPAQDNDKCRVELRQAIFGSYRILFTMREEDSLV